MEFLNKMLGTVSDSTSFVVYVVIVLLFVFGVVRCTFPVVRTRARLRKAISEIKSGNAKKAWQEDGFLGNGALFSHWSEYLNNLFFADGMYHNASKVEDYINEDTVIYSPGNSGFADVLPGLMVSMGFMGTLIGLSIGLSGFEMGNEEAIMGSIETLIPGMRYAFMTSIVGVIGSVSFSLITRFVNGSTERSLTMFYSAMSRYAGVLSVDPMTQVAIYQQEQTALIKTMSKDLNGKFTERITEVISDSTQPLTDAMTNFVRVTTEEQMRFLDTVVTRFVTHMDKSLSGRFQELSNAIGETARNQQRLLAAVDVQVSSVARSSMELTQLEQKASSMVSKLDAYMSKLSLSQKQLDESSVRVMSGMEMMSSVSQKQTDCLKSVSQIQTDVSNAMKALSNSVNTLSSAGDELLEIRKTMEKEAARYSDKMTDVTRASLNEARQDIDNMLVSLNEYIRDYTARVDEASAVMSDSASRLPDAVNAVADQFLDQMDRLNAAINRAQRTLNDTIERR